MRTIVFNLIDDLPAFDLSVKSHASSTQSLRFDLKP